MWRRFLFAGLFHKGSIFASPALDFRILVPHFNAVPYALGLSIFPQETLFAQLIVASWTIILLLLVFGYFFYRFNSTYGLAAAMLCVFNDHMFFSGANSPVIINSALIAFIFAAVYNFWESARNHDHFRFMLALIFLSQLLANKLQAVYVLAFLTTLGFLVQPHLKEIVTKAVRNKRWIMGVSVAAGICGLWFLKNGLATGNPFFPALAGEFKTLNWTKELSTTFTHYFPGPLPLALIIKYLSYLFIWPGINAAKLTWVMLISLPLWLMLAYRFKTLDEGRVGELCFWFGTATMVLVGTMLASFPDPRLFRYGIALMASASIVGLDFILKNCFRFNQTLTSVVIVLVALQGFRIAIAQGEEFHYPTFAQNRDVLLNRLHMKDILPIYYPDQEKVTAEFLARKDLQSSSAWDAGVGGVTSLSAFLLPIRPQVGLGHTTAVGFDSYADPRLIEEDLKANGILWVMGCENGHLKVESIKDYAQRATRFERFPKTLFYNYGFPQELARIRGY